MTKLTLVVIFVLFTFVRIGSSLWCYQCSGDLKQCNREDAAYVNCSAGFTSCASMMLYSADSMDFLYGCAKPQDCQAAKSACDEMAKDEESQVSCSATCCSGRDCIKPYSKDTKFRKCYQCTSTRECEMAKPSLCPNEDYRCYKIATAKEQFNVQLKTNSKGCATKSGCDQYFQKYNQECPDDFTCDATCCEGDMCNAASNAVVSTFILIASALFAFVILV